MTTDDKSASKRSPQTVLTSASKLQDHHTTIRQAPQQPLTSEQSSLLCFLDDEENGLSTGYLAGFFGSNVNKIVVSLRKLGYEIPCKRRRFVCDPDQLVWVYRLVSCPATGGPQPW